MNSPHAFQYAQNSASGHGGGHDHLDFGKLAEMKQELGDSFLTVLRHFQAGIQSRSARIVQAVADGNPELVSMESHSLKSVCRQIGLNHMGTLAATLENLGRTGSLQDAPFLVEQLISASNTADHELTRYCALLDKTQPSFSGAGRASAM